MTHHIIRHLPKSHSESGLFFEASHENTSLLITLRGRETNRKSRRTIRRFPVDVFFIENPESMETNPNKNSKMHPTLQEQQISARHQRSMGQKNLVTLREPSCYRLKPHQTSPKKTNSKNRVACGGRNWSSLLDCHVSKWMFTSWSQIVIMAGQPPPPQTYLLQK